MKKIAKWVFIITGGLIFITILVLLLVPLFVDLKDYKPVIERKVSAATGRSFSIGDDLSLSLFPWAGISLSDLQLGNPPGFDEKEMLSIKTFNVQVKLLPLLFKDIQVERFVIEEPVVMLVQKKDGRTNWKTVGQPAPGPKSKKETQPSADSQAPAPIPLAALTVGEMSVTNGKVAFSDQKTGQRVEVSDLNLKLADVSFDQPIQIGFSAQIDQKPLSLEGQIGPVGKDFLTRSIPLELTIKALDQLESSLKGQVSSIILQPQFQLTIETNVFSPQDLLGRLGPEFKIETKDPNVLQKLSLKSKVTGTTQQVTLTDGSITLDDTNIDFVAAAKDFNRPNLTFDVKLDAIDIDRYLAPEAESDPSATASKSKAKGTKPAKTDYTPLRKLILDGTLAIERLTVSRAHLDSLQLKLNAKNGLIRIEPLAFNLYQGSVASNATVDVRKNTPTTGIQLKSQGIQVAPLLKDLHEKEILEGTLNSDVKISMVGDTPEMIKKSLTGQGNLQFNDGAIVGIDLAGMVRNVKSAFGLGGAGGEKPRTDFTELAIPFTLTNGRFHTPDTKMASPLLRLKAKGNADLVKESLDMRIEPKVVATIVGQGDTKQRTGLVEVPIIVSGTFASPTFRPDLKAMLSGSVEKTVSSEVKKLTGGTDKGKAVEESTQKLIKGFLGGD
jgi:AsmA protein